MAEAARLKDFGGVVRAGELYRGKQGPNYTPGVSTETVGSRALWLGSVTLPPHGGRTKAHFHENHESAFYLVSGEDVEVYTGEQLEHREVAQVGDYLYFPAGVPHVAVNRGGTPAIFVGGAYRPQRAGERGDAPGAGREGALASKRPSRSRFFFSFLWGCFP